MPIASIWSDELVASLRQLWDEGLSCREISLKLNVSRNTICGKAARLGLSSRVPAEQLERIRIRDRAKKAKRRAARKAAKQAEMMKQATNLRFSRTSAEYRKHLPPAPEMSKSQMRAFLAQAVRNTAGASA